MNQLLALARTARGERGRLPRARRFLPLIAVRAVPQRARARGSVLTDRAARLARGSIVLQLPPVRTEETLKLAAGCRRSGGVVRVPWPADGPRAAFAEWHRAVIRSGLLPYVEIVSEADPAASDVALVHRQA